MSINENNWHIEIAKEIKKRDNEEYIGTIVGRVINGSPVSISILDGNALLNESSLHIANNLKAHTEQVTVNINGTEYQGTVKFDGLKINDRVVLIAAEDNQTFFVIEKL